MMLFCAPVTVLEFFVSLNDEEKKASKLLNSIQLLLSYIYRRPVSLGLRPVSHTQKHTKNLLFWILVGI
jgi:hypothetical protein